MTGWPEVREVQVRTVTVHGVSVRTTVSQPATTFIRYKDFKNIIDDDNNEKDEFKNMCNQNIDSEKPTDNLYFVTSLKDNKITQMKLKNNFQGFQLITFLGLNSIHTDKIHKDSSNYEKQLNSPIDEKLFDEEINDTAKKLPSYLINNCQLTKMHQFKMNIIITIINW